MARAHKDRAYDGELRRLQEKLLLMGAKVEELLSGSVRAFMGRDESLARRVIEADAQVNRLEVDIDELCLCILARRQPVASDLRFIATALKLVKDLERIGDLGVNICERALELLLEPPLRIPPAVESMASVALAMVHDALDAFVADDPGKATQVIERDRVVDAACGEVFELLLHQMTADASIIGRATRVQSVVKALERVGDHATNLAEMVVFMVHGQDIRHAELLGEGSAPALRVASLLFVSGGSGARSQMAEAIARARLPSFVHVRAAPAPRPRPVDGHALQVLREAGFAGAAPAVGAVAEADYVVALGRGELPFDRRRLQRFERWDVPDPAELAGEEGTVLAAYRNARDELMRRIDDLSRRL